MLSPPVAGRGCATGTVCCRWRHHRLGRTCMMTQHKATSANGSRALGMQSVSVGWVVSIATLPRTTHQHHCRPAHPCCRPGGCCHGQYCPHHVLQCRHHGRHCHRHHWRHHSHQGSRRPGTRMSQQAGGVGAVLLHHWRQLLLPLHLPLLAPPRWATSAHLGKAALYKNDSRGVKQKQRMGRYGQ